MGLRQRNFSDNDGSWLRDSFALMPFPSSIPSGIISLRNSQSRLRAFATENRSPIQQEK
jgi:hypothetical protein